MWLGWSSGFLVPWLALYVTNPQFRLVMWRVSLVTAVGGLTEPIFVPEYWNPPSLFELAQRTGFDIESLMFCFAIGGIGAVSYNALTGAVFLVLYALFMLGLVWFTPGYIPQVWNLAALSGGLVGGIPPEELFFGFTFGWYWTGVYEHFTWRTSAALAVTHGRHGVSNQMFFAASCASASAR